MRKMQFNPINQSKETFYDPCLKISEFGIWYDLESGILRKRDTDER